MDEHVLHSKVNTNATALDTSTPNNGNLSSAQQASGLKTWNEAELCEICRNIDFEALYEHRFELSRWYKEVPTPFPNYLTLEGGVIVAELNYVRTGPTCMICQTLVPYAFGEEVRDGKFELHVYLKESKAEKGTTDILLVVADPSKQLLDYGCFWLSDNHDEKAFSNVKYRNSSDPIDWQIVKNWLKYCEDEHTICRQYIQPSMRGLTVIDCETRRLSVLPSDSSPYITLSYVWGDQGFIPPHQNDTLHSVPILIQDSIGTVLALGFKYLWIDRYCISQKDRGERHRLIQQMGKIYRNSYMTLIASGGESPEDGLPGVSSSPRETPQTLLTARRRFQMRPLIFNMIDHIENSKWASRGWTFQEAALACRRLAFTREGLYFQCRETNFEEQFPYRPVFSEGPAIFRNTDSDGYAEDSVEDFCLRQFTYDNDVLDAFRGILGQLRNLSDPITSLCGLPFYTRMPNMWTKTDCLISSLLWRACFHNKLIEENSEAMLIRTLPRRAKFPSWTWAGWKFATGSSWCRLTPIDIKHPQFYAGKVHIAVQYDDDAVMKFEENHDEILAREASGYSPSYLRLQAFSFRLQEGDLQLRSREQALHDRECLKHFQAFNILALCDLVLTFGKEVFSCRFSLDVSTSRIFNTQCRAVLMTESDILFICPAVNGSHYERIGVGTLTSLIIDGGFADGDHTEELFRSANATWDEILLG